SDSVFPIANLALPSAVLIAGLVSACLVCPETSRAQTVSPTKAAQAITSKDVGSASLSPEGKEKGLAAFTGKLGPSPYGSDVRVLPIDLPTALRLADANNPTIALARERINEAYANLRQAQALLL